MNTIMTLGSIQVALKPVALIFFLVPMLSVGMQIKFNLFKPSKPYISILIPTLSMKTSQKGNRSISQFGV